MVNSGCISNQQMPYTANYFKEEVISKILEIPQEKPGIKRILNFDVFPKVEGYKIIETEIGMSNEGQNLSGVKLLVKLKIKSRLTYIADTCSQQVYSACYDEIKTMFIVLPEEVNGQNICSLIKSGKLSIVPYVECVETRVLKNRLFQKCVLIFLNVENL